MVQRIAPISGRSVVICNAARSREITSEQQREPKLPVADSTSTPLAPNIKSSPCAKFTTSMIRRSASGRTRRAQDHAGDDAVQCLNHEQIERHALEALLSKSILDPKYC